MNIAEKDARALQVHTFLDGDGIPVSTMQITMVMASMVEKEVLFHCIDISSVASSKHTEYDRVGGYCEPKIVKGFRRLVSPQTFGHFTSKAGTKDYVAHFPQSTEGCEALAIAIAGDPDLKCIEWSPALLAFFGVQKYLDADFTGIGNFGAGFVFDDDYLQIFGLICSVGSKMNGPHCHGDIADVILSSATLINLHRQLEGELPIPIGESPMAEMAWGKGRGQVCMERMLWAQSTRDTEGWVRSSYSSFSAATLNWCRRMSVG